MIPEALLALAALVVWDLGRRFASRGRQVSSEDLEHLTDRVTVCEAVSKDWAQLQENFKVLAGKHQVMALNVAEHGKAITSLGLRGKRG